jgi:hypothetical protein
LHIKYSKLLTGIVGIFSGAWPNLFGGRLELGYWALCSVKQCPVRLGTYPVLLHGKCTSEEIMRTTEDTFRKGVALHYCPILP